MMEDRDFDLTTEEKRAFASLPRERPSPRDLEDRVLDTLREKGLIDTRPSPRRRSTWAVAAAAAIVFIAGVAAGRLLLAPAPDDQSAQFVLLLHRGADEMRGLTDEEMRGRVREYGAWARKERAAGHMVRGERLTDEIRFVAAAAREEAKSGENVVSGLFLIRAADYEEALRIARDCPHAKYGGRIEVRRIDLL